MNVARAAILVQYFGHLVEAVNGGAGEAYRELMDDVNIELINELGLPAREEKPAMNITVNVTNSTQNAQELAETFSRKMAEFAQRNGHFIKEQVVNI